MSSPTPSASPAALPIRLSISPLIQISLWLFYLALVTPLPVLAHFNQVGTITLGDFWERTHGLNWLDEDVPFR
ncbi:hypothetical protein [Acaryochloris sp. IP29b_bin.148]|uniref:hypothetical protein n=1 Tax=Acaryochloris sp. IP29b_bin.148 TaxID=2969218 RepID=UPI00261BA057|nr:hypothetical protein [Acaryochloris sp. IP29b_bin.148]